MKQTTADWEKYFRSNDVDDQTLSEYVEYIKALLANDVPIIFEIDHLSSLLSIEHSELTKVINSPHSFYRTFNIPKRKGGIRIISMPYPTLLFIQRWIKTNILDKVELNDSAHGFIKNKSIITNANVHLKNKTILKMDITDFFPSINIGRVISVFHKFGYSTKVSYYLAALCTLDNKLPQGAATSPSISNIISKKMDHRLKRLSNSFGVLYTRYADDLTFSGHFISPRFIPLVSKILSEEGFKVNDAKTKLITGKGKKIITGISINSGILKLPKSKKRLLRKEGYYVAKYPVKFAKAFREDPFYIDQLIGKYNFWLQIEPDNTFARDTIKKLKNIANSLADYSI